MNWLVHKDSHKIFKNIFKNWPSQVFLWIHKYQGIKQSHWPNETKNTMDESNFHWKIRQFWPLLERGCSNIKMLFLQKWDKLGNNIWNIKEFNDLINRILPKSHTNRPIWPHLCILGLQAWFFSSEERRVGEAG